MLHEETGYDFASEELHPMSESLEDMLIREEESLETDEVEEFWSQMAATICDQESEGEPAPTGNAFVSTSFSF